VNIISKDDYDKTLLVARKIIFIKTIINKSYSFVCYYIIHMGIYIILIRKEYTL